MIGLYFLSLLSYWSLHGVMYGSNSFNNIELLLPLIVCLIMILLYLKWHMQRVRQNTHNKYNLIRDGLIGILQDVHPAILQTSLTLRYLPEMYYNIDGGYKKEEASDGSYFSNRQLQQPLSYTVFVDIHSKRR